MAINSDKPHLWKADVERSIDFYNDWFIRFAPETYRAQRRITTEAVLDAFGKTVGDATNTNKRRKEEAQKLHQLKKRYGDDITFLRS
ncbi:MAG: XamI family restriction endonuclease [Kiritimatiellia bacterium]